MAGYSQQYQGTGYDQMHAAARGDHQPVLQAGHCQPRDSRLLERASPRRRQQVPDDQAATTTDQQVMFLIALKDHTIFPAIAYWVEGDTLNYITVQGAKNSVSLDLVDRDFSKQINKERKVEFGLPSK